MSDATNHIVLVFGPLRELIQSDRVTVSLPANATARDVLNAIESQYAGFAPFRGRIAVACNQRIIPMEAPIQQGDDIALIPPVSGG